MCKHVTALFALYVHVNVIMQKGNVILEQKVKKSKINNKKKHDMGEKYFNTVAICSKNLVHHRTLP